MAKETNAYFIEHCWEEDCDLGVFETDCPCCNSLINDYDLWWKRYSLPLYFKCKECGANLIVEFNKNQWKFITREDNGKR